MGRERLLAECMRGIPVQFVNWLAAHGDGRFGVTIRDEGRRTLEQRRLEAHRRPRVIVRIGLHHPVIILRIGVIGMGGQRVAEGARALYDVQTR